MDFQVFNYTYLLLKWRGQQKFTLEAFSLKDESTSPMNEHSLVHLDTAAFGDEIGAGRVLLWLFLDLTVFRRCVSLYSLAIFQCL